MLLQFANRLSPFELAKSRNAFAGNRHIPITVARDTPANWPAFLYVSFWLISEGLPCAVARGIWMFIPILHQHCPILIGERQGQRAQPSLAPLNRVQFREH